MRRLGTLILLFFMVITSSGRLIGSKERSFTEDKRMEYAYNDIALTNVLFYISGPITMKRVLPKTKTKEENFNKGRVAFENGQAFEYYELVDGASAKFENESEDETTLTMRFGIDQDEMLKFKKAKGSGDTNSYYELVSRKGSKEGENFIDFLGKEWQLISYSKVRLNIKEKRNTKVNVDKTKSRGMKMDGTEKKGLFKKKN